MTADLVDLTARHLVDFRNANRAEKAAAAPYPDPVWRPGDPTPKQKAKAERRRALAARAAYLETVAIVTPQHARG